MRTGSVALAGILLAHLTVSSAIAEPIQYHVSGTLQPIPGHSDFFGLDGAHFDLAISGDKDLGPAYPYSSNCINQLGYCTAGFSLSQLPTTLTISDRPNGLPAYTVDMIPMSTLSPPGARFDFVNYDPPAEPLGIAYDLMVLPRMQAGPQGFTTSGIWLYFSPAFFGPPDAAFRLPTIQPSDLLAVVSSPGGNEAGGSWDGHNITNVSISTVPIPPAVWLFGSALSVIGVMRRKIST